MFDLVMQNACSYAEKRPCARASTSLRIRVSANSTTEPRKPAQRILLPTTKDITSNWTSVEVNTSFFERCFFSSHLLTNESQREKCLGHFNFWRPPSLFAKIGPWLRKGNFILGYASLATVSQIILVTAMPQTERPFVYDTCGF